MNCFKNVSWDVIILEIGIGLVKLLWIESEEMYNKYWSVFDWCFKEVMMIKVFIVIKDFKMFNLKVIKYKIVEEVVLMDSIVFYIGMLWYKNDYIVVLNLFIDYLLELK